MVRVATDSTPYEPSAISGGREASDTGPTEEQHVVLTDSSDHYQRPPPRPSLPNLESIKSDPGYKALDPKAQDQVQKQLLQFAHFPKERAEIGRLYHTAGFDKLSPDEQTRLIKLQGDQMLKNVRSADKDPSNRALTDDLQKVVSGWNKNGTPADERDATLKRLEANPSDPSVRRTAIDDANRTPTQRAFGKNAEQIAQQVNGRFGFANQGQNVGANDKFWDIDRTTGQISVKAGVKPSDAVKDFLAHPEQYQLECGGAQKMIEAAALMKTYGDDDKFNAVCAKHGGLIVGQKTTTGVVADLLKPVRQAQNFDPNLTPPLTRADDPTQPSWLGQNMRPGDSIYFKNPAAGAGSPFQGENCIYLGNGKFFAHGFGKDSIMSETEIVAHLKAHGGGTVLRTEEAYRPDPDAL
jgi:hypothetical protein